MTAMHEALVAHTVELKVVDTQFEAVATDEGYENEVNVWLIVCSI